MIPRLQELYRSQIAVNLTKSFSYKNSMQAPKVAKIVVNMGVGEAITDIKILEKASEELAIITGQRPSVTKAKKAISNFKIKQGIPIGCRVTLRGKIMYEFLDRLVNVAIPRIRDFRGLRPNSFDGSGNYSFGITEQSIFPEIDADRVTHIQGLDITIVTTTNSNEQALALLKQFGIPFRERSSI